MRNYVITVIFSMLFYGVECNVSASQWYLGNLHCHSARSHDVHKKTDTTQSPREMAELYRSEGFDFLCVSDHDRAFNNDPKADAGVRITDSESLSVVENGKTVFLGITGSEISLHNPHVGGVGIKQLLPKSLSYPAARFNAVREQGGVAILNHPRYKNRFANSDREAALTISNMGDIRFMEIWNANTVDVRKVTPRSGHPEIDTWDLLLNRGIYIMGVAADDEHFVAGLANPRIWGGMTGGIMVRAEQLERDDILAGMRRGDMYAVARPSRNATWCVFDKQEINSKGISVSSPNAVELDFVVYDMSGQRLAIPTRTAKTGEGIEATYTFDGYERYVRIQAVNADGAWAMSMPSFRLPLAARQLRVQVQNDFDSVGGGKVEVSWISSNDPAALSQSLLRKLAGSGQEEIIKLERRQASYLDGNVKRGELWRYRILTHTADGRADAKTPFAEALVQPGGMLVDFSDPLQLSAFSVIDDPSATTHAPSQWFIDNGVLHQHANIYAKGADLLGSCALLKQKGNDYRFEFDFATGDDDCVGCVWRYNGHRRYYALQWDCDRKRKKPLLRVVKYDGGVQPTVLRDLAAPYFKGVSYHIEVLALSDIHKITISSGGLAQPYTMTLKDATHKTGPPGLYCSGSVQVNFDNVRFRASPK
jgi:hypothetical protein